MRKQICAMCALVLAFAWLGRDATAGYQDEQDAKNLGVVERAVAKFHKNPALFDGTKIVPGASARAANSHAAACNNVIRTFNSYFARVSKKGMRTPRAQAVYQKVKALNPWCKALTAANAIYLSNAKAAESAAASSRAARKSTCDSMRRDAIREVKGIHDVLDTWSGGRTPGAAEHITEFRGKLNQLVTVCSKPEYKDVVTSCKGYGIMSSSATNKRYDYGDICAPAADPKKTLTDVAMRMLNSIAGRSKQELPTVEKFRRWGDGWIHDTKPVLYKTRFTVTDKRKKDLMTAVKAAFVAAGVDVPKDLSSLWAHQQQYLDALKAAVDATAGEWKLTEGRCAGYTCGLAKRRIKRDHPRARVKAVHGKRWKIVKNALGIPLERYYGMLIVYKVPGEPYCQVRSLTAHEKYKGGGRYRRPKGLEGGYVRFQKSCR